MNDLKFVFMHVPKCAGTSVHNFLLQNVPEARLCPERFNNFHALSIEELDRFNLFSAHTDFAGVQRIPGRKFTLTTLRDPKERVLSLYRFWRSHDKGTAFRNRLWGPLAAHCLSFPDFLRYEGPGIQSNIRNAMVRNFLGRAWADDRGALVIDDASAVDLALRNLETFDLIGMSDDFASMLNELSAILGVKPPRDIPIDNRSPPDEADRESHTSEVSELVDELTRLDRTFFEGARAIVEGRRSRRH